MTDKTDIAALTRPVRDRYDWSNAVWRDCDQCGKQHTGTVTAEDDSQICAHCADQLYWSAWQVLAERALDQLEVVSKSEWKLAGELTELQMNYNALQQKYEAERQRCAEITEQYVDRTTALSFATQRAESAELELIKPLPIGELIQRLEGQTYEKCFSQSDLKGEQVPFAYAYHRDTGVWWLSLEKPKLPGYTEVRELFTAPQKLTDLPYDVLFNAIAKSATPLGEHMSISVKDFKAAIEAAGGLPTPQATIEAAPQKPIISKEKLCDWLEDNFDIDDSQRDAFAKCFAHHCNCIVKDGD